MLNRRGPSSVLNVIACLSFIVLLFLILTDTLGEDEGPCQPIPHNNASSGGSSVPNRGHAPRRSVIIEDLVLPGASVASWQPTRAPQTAEPSQAPTEADLLQSLHDVDIMITPQGEIKLYPGPEAPAWVPVVFKPLLSVTKDPLCVGETSTSIPHVTIIVDQHSLPTSARMSYVWGSIHVLFQPRNTTPTVALRLSISQGSPAGTEAGSTLPPSSPPRRGDTFQQMMDVVLMISNATTLPLSALGKCIRVRQLAVPLLQLEQWPERNKLDLRSKILKHFDLEPTQVTKTPKVAVYSGVDSATNRLDNAEIVLNAFRRAMPSHGAQDMFLIKDLESLSFEEQLRSLHKVNVLFTAEGEVVMLSLFMPLYARLYVVLACSSPHTSALQLLPTQNIRQWRMCDVMHGGSTICVPNPKPGSLESENCEINVDYTFAWLTIGAMLTEDISAMTESLLEFVGPPWVRSLLESMYVEREYNASLFLERYALTSAYVAGFGGRRLVSETLGHTDYSI